jgi:hypothetical protein
MITSIIAGIVIPIMFYNIATRLGATWLFTLKPEKKPIPPVIKQEPKVTISRLPKQGTAEIFENISNLNR